MYSISLKLGLTPIQIAFIMMAPSLIYIVSTPIIGYLCDKVFFFKFKTKNLKFFKYKNIMKWFMLLSTLIAAASFSLIAPVSFLNLKL